MSPTGRNALGWLAVALGGALILCFGRPGRLRSGGGLLYWMAKQGEKDLPPPRPGPPWRECLYWLGVALIVAGVVLKGLS